MVSRVDCDSKPQRLSVKLLRLLLVLSHTASTHLNRHRWLTAPKKMKPFCRRLPHLLVVAVTELVTDEDVEALASALTEELSA